MRLVLAALLFIFVAGTLSSVLRGPGKTYIGFAVDDTRSMREEIEGVKLWITGCVFAPGVWCPYTPTGGWLLSPFNDPGVGPIVGPDTNFLFSFLPRVLGLIANGGGDCPELAFTGLMRAATAIGAHAKALRYKVLHCVVYFFSDANAKDAVIQAAAIAAFRDANCKWILILTGDCTEGGAPIPIFPGPALRASGIPFGNMSTVNTTLENIPSPPPINSTSIPGSNFTDLLFPPSATGPNITTYEELASAIPNVFIYRLPKPTSATQFSDYLGSTFSLNICPTDQIAGPLPLGFRNEIDCTSHNACWDFWKKRCLCPLPPLRCPRRLKKCPRNRPGTKYPDPTDCRFFLACVNGVVIRHCCNQGFVFNPETEMCDNPKNVLPPCGTKRPK